MRGGQLTLNFLAGFLGWFAGLVVAQWRIGTLDQPGERRVASLSSRNLRDYVTGNNLLLVGVAVFAWLVLAVLAVLRVGFTVEWWGYLLYSVLVLGALALTARTVINRPSGFVDPDVREADHALRAHGLTVLVGSTIALLYPPIWTFAVQVAYPDGVPFSIDPVWTFLIMLACLLVGWYVASASRSVRR